MFRIPLAAASVVVVLAARPGLGTVLTFDGALERARREAPAILAARLRPEEARGRLAGASVLLRENPVLDVTGGRRDSDRGVSTDIETSLGQTFELGGQRGARVRGAEAGVEQELAAAEDTTRETLRDVASAFIRTVASEELVRVVRQNQDVAADLLAVAERRHSAGDIPDLDLNVAQVAAARARAAVRAAESARDIAIRNLKVALGVDAAEPIEVRGDLRLRQAPPLPDLLVSVAGRPDLRALADELRVADAEAQLGSRSRWPDLGFRVGFKREEDADVPLAGVSLSLPVFVNGQEQRATGTARARRLRLELDFRRRAAEVEVRAGLDAYVRLADAVGDLERHALPVLEQNDALARRAYDAGELSLPDYLLVRRETLGTRLDYVDRSLEAALAAVDLESRAGVLR
ncbi:MAG: TolC family protein [Candidatus Binatia bacterium]